MRFTQICLVAAVISPAALAAQAPAYHFAQADTLRYREVSVGTMEVVSPQGAIPLETYHDARMAITRGRAGTLLAWYDSLAVSMTSPQGVNAPHTEAALGQQFVLEISPSGRVKTVRTQVFPSTFEGVTDLRLQFSDYLVPLPDRPFAPGVTWTDSLTRGDSTSEGRHSLMSRLGTYRVVGDTLIGGNHAWVIEAVVQQSRLSSGPSQGMTVTSELGGEERGFFYWDAVGGRLLGRSRAATLVGTMQVSGAANVEMEQRLEYRNSLTLIE